MSNGKETETGENSLESGIQDDCDSTKSTQDLKVMEVTKTFPDRTSPRNDDQVSIDSSIIAQELDNLTCKLRRLYGTEDGFKPLPWMRKTAPRTSFVPLNIQLLDSAGKNVIGVFQSQNLILEAIEGENTSPRTVLVSGERFSGKTTLLRTLAHDWGTKNAREFQTFTTLLVYNLKDLRDQEDIKSALTNELMLFYPQNDSTISQLTWLKAATSNMMILLDDYDALSKKGRRDLDNFFREESIFTSCTIIVTATNLPAKHFLEKFARKLLIGKLCNSSVDGIISMTCCNETKSMEVQELLKDNIAVEEYVNKSPFMLHTLCHVLNNTNKKEFPNRSDLCYQIMYEIMVNILKYFANDFHYVGNDHLRNVINELGKFIFTKRVKNQSIVYQSELEEHFEADINLLIHLGIFQQQPKKKDCFELANSVLTNSLAVAFGNKNLHNLVQHLTAGNVSQILSTDTMALLENDGKICLVINFAERFHLFLRHDDLIDGCRFETEEYAQMRINKSCFRVLVTLGPNCLAAIFKNKPRVDLLPLQMMLSPMFDRHVQGKAVRIFMFLGFIKPNQSSFKRFCLTTFATFSYLNLDKSNKSTKKLERFSSSYKTSLVLLSSSVIVALPYAVLWFALRKVPLGSTSFSAAVSATTLQTGAVFLGASLASATYLHPVATVTLHQSRNIASSCLLSAGAITKLIGGEVKTGLRWMFLSLVFRRIAAGLLTNYDGFYGHFCNVALPYYCLYAGAVMLERIADFCLSKIVNYYA